MTGGGAAKRAGDARADVVAEPEAGRDRLRGSRASTSERWSDMRERHVAPVGGRDEQFRRGATGRLEPRSPAGRHSVGRLSPPQDDPEEYVCLGGDRKEGIGWLMRPPAKTFED